MAVLHLLRKAVADFLAVTLSGRDENQVIRAGEAVRSSLEKRIGTGSARLLGPTPLAVVKVNDRYRYRVHIACRADRNLRAALSQTVIEANTDKRFRGVSVYADNDPGD